jgi:UDP-N-acetylglucosamine 1-carboxyvinyltransferase
MDRIRITGGVELNGTIPISGAKNAALPLMIAALLTEEPVVLENVPRLADVAQLKRILSNHGVDISVRGRRHGETETTGETIEICAKTIVDTTAPYDLVSTMRASFWVLGPLVARIGHARVSLPGGCAIGTRPVDFHLDALRALGAVIEIDGGYVVATARHGLKGAEIRFPKVSVGATHTALMAAALAEGETVLINAAREPEVVDLAELLIKMGATITGAGSPEIRITGAAGLHGATHSVVADRIETGTFALAVGMAGGDVVLEGARAELLESAVDAMRAAGMVIEPTARGLRVARNGNGLRPVEITTEPYPGFPTDLQAQFMAMVTMAEGTSRISETIFENRFMHVQELARLGAQIRLDGDTAVIEGVRRLTGAPVMATDLRASVSLVIAGLAAEGETTVNRIYHLDRGFERLEHKLSRCGARIERVSA